MPAWSREETPRTLTKPHRQLMALLTGLGLEVRLEVRVGRYALDILVEELWLGFEADGTSVHAGPRKRKRDATRDLWIYDNARIPVLRVDEEMLRASASDAAMVLIDDFIKQHSSDVEERKEQGKWVVV